jgi:hypothetical protein
MCQTQKGKPMSYDGDLDRVRKRAEEQGWRYRRTERGHHQFYSPDKETIVTAAGTPSDQRGWLNFLADMKRGGFKVAEEYGTVAQALVEARVIKPDPSSPQVEQSVEPSSPQVTTTQESSEVKQPKVTAVQHVRSLLRNKPDHEFTMPEIVAKVQAADKSHKASAINMAAKSLTDKGELTRVRLGTYQWKGDSKKTRIGRPPKADVHPDKATNGSGASMDEDLVAMDAALAALEKVGEIILRNREVLLKFAELKKLLPGA